VCDPSTRHGYRALLGRRVVHDRPRPASCTADEVATGRLATFLDEARPSNNDAAAPRGFLEPGRRRRLTTHETDDLQAPARHVMFIYRQNIWTEPARIFGRYTSVMPLAPNSAVPTQRPRNSSEV
jgi:hypothetical protein